MQAALQDRKKLQKNFEQSLKYRLSEALKLDPNFKTDKTRSNDQLLSTIFQDQDQLHSERKVKKSLEHGLIQPKRAETSNDASMIQAQNTIKQDLNFAEMDEAMQIITQKLCNEHFIKLLDKSHSPY